MVIRVKYNRGRMPIKILRTFASWREVGSEGGVRSAVLADGVTICHLIIIWHGF